MPGGGHAPEYDFNEAKPAGTDYVYEIDNWVISNQKHWDNAYAVEHYSPSNDPDASEDDFGRHDFITLKEQAAKPDLSGSTNRHALYAKSDGFYAEDESGDEILLVSFGTPSVAAFPSGTICVFGNTSAPTGWTKKTDWEDKAALTINSDADGTALDSGGDMPLQNGHAHQEGTLANSAHNHKWYDFIALDHRARSYSSDGSSNVITHNTAVGGGGVEMTNNSWEINEDLWTANATPSISGETGSNNANSDQFYYQEVILATKD
jgi:hypothetical protein